MVEGEKNTVNVSRKEISPQQVRERENIDGVLETHKKITKRPVYKQRKFYFFLFLLLLLTLIIYYTEKEENSNNIENTERTN